MAANTTPRVQSVKSPEEFEALAPLEKVRRATFDNVNASVRRRIALEIPFHECRFGEDLDWAHRALLAGYTIVYEPRSGVIHSHNRSPWYELKRVYLDHQNLYRLFGLHVVPRPQDLMWRTIAGAGPALRTVARDRSLALSSRVRWWSRALPYSFGASLAQYLGARSARRMGKHQSFYRWLDRRLGRGV